jgi:peptidoglycan/xylan/chitin deacetylase (PgdA/CDA1 family)
MSDPLWLRGKNRLRGWWSGVLRWYVRLSGRKVGFVLVYHALAERHGDPRRELVAPHGRANFRAQMEHLRRYYEPVRMSQLQEATGRRRRGQKVPVAVTFDDDLRSHIEIAAPELRAAGVPAAFFLTGRTLDGPQEFWWGPVQRAVDQGLLERDGGGPALAQRLGLRWVPDGDEPPLRTFARAFEGAPPAARDAAVPALIELVGPDGADPGLQAEHVRALAQGTLEVGFHTRRHDRLDWLEDDAAVRRAVTEGRDVVEQAAGAPLLTFSYPHGGVDERSAAAVREAGYLAGLTSKPWTVKPHSDRALVGRFYPTYSTIVQFGIDVARMALR